MFQRGTQMVRTVLKNRFQKFAIPSDGDMKGKDKGIYVERSARIESVELSVYFGMMTKQSHCYQILLKANLQKKCKDFQRKKNNMYKFLVQKSLQFIINAREEWIY